MAGAAPGDVVVKPLIVGQAPGRTPGEPLAGRVGRRLAALCGLTERTYLEAFDRMNVLEEWPGKAGRGDTFRLVDAIPAARQRVLPLLPERTHVVLLGGAALAVERALTQAGHSDARDLSWARFVWHHVRIGVRSTVALTCCPHPSGASQWWNKPENVQEARRFWTELTRSSAARA